MKMSMNKRLTVANKAIDELFSDHALTQPEPENKVIAKVAGIVAGIQAMNPEKLDEYKRGMDEAKQKWIDAQEAKDAAESEADFNKACDAEDRAKDRYRFFEKQYSRVKYSARMDEAAYFEAVQQVQEAVTAEAEEYRQKALAAVESLAEAWEKYDRTVTDADNTLVSLDDAANVLQTKFRQRAMSFTTDKPDVDRVVYVDDPNEWERHTVRFRHPNSGRPSMYNMALDQGSPDELKLRAAYQAIRILMDL